MASSVGPIYNLGQTQSTTQKDTSTKKPGQMGKDEFLKLLVTQLQYQDPLKPMDDQQFIGQMAQFSSLEQMQNLNTSFTATKALSLVGKYIEGTISNNGIQEAVKGNIDSIKMSGSKAYAVVGSQEISVDDIEVIKDGSNTQKNADITKYAQMTGKNVKTIVAGLQTNEVYEVDGNVGAIKIVQSQNEQIPVAVLNGVKEKVDSLLLSQGDVQIGTVKAYLESKIGKTVTANVIDADGRKAKLTGVVNSVSGDDVNPDVVFDEVNTTVDSIYQVGG